MNRGWGAQRLGCTEAGVHRGWSAQRLGCREAGVYRGWGAQRLGCTARLGCTELEWREGVF